MHELYADPEVRDAVVERWGPEVAPGGAVDRSAVARRAFADAEEREWLEGLLWPRVGRADRRLARAASRRANRAPRALVVEVPLLFESGHGPRLRRDDRRRRRRGRSGASAPPRAGTRRVDERTARQLTQEEKAARATYAVANSGTLEELESRLSDVLAKLRP